MELAARRFARWVLIFHVALFGLVLLIIALTVRVLYQGARHQAIQQSAHTQELLARQTVLGLENYYESIAGLLELLQPPQPPGAEARDRRNQPRSGSLDDPTFDRMSKAVWKSVSDRASLLYISDPQSDHTLVQLIGARDDSPQPQAVTDALANWLAGVQDASISRYLRFEKSGGGHVVCVPLRGPTNLLIVAFVPIASVEQTVLHDVNARATIGAMLVADAGMIISHSRRDTVGLNVLTDIKDPRTRELARQYLVTGAAGTEIFEQSERIGEVWMDPAMSTMQPAEILGARWYLVISSSLGHIDAIVNPIFRDAMLWAGFIMLALTAVFTSTAIQMIRSRIRLERVRHEVLTRELTQAREIQLAWLPKNEDDPPFIDLDAVNLPATHISGDFYNWFALDDGRTVVVIGDVTGHGIAAAFMMATTQLLIRTTMPRCADPGQCLREVNRQLCMQVFNGQFVTMLVLVIDVHKGSIELANAGHPPPIFGHGDKFLLMDVAPQLVLGIDSDIEYASQRFDLASESILVLYTDGATDAQNPLGDRFGIDGLLGSLYGHYEDAQAVIDIIVGSVNKFRRDRELADDLTLVAIQLQPVVASGDAARGVGAATTQLPI